MIQKSKQHEGRGFEKTSLSHSLRVRRQNKPTGFVGDKPVFVFIPSYQIFKNVLEMLCPTMEQLQHMFGTMEPFDDIFRCKDLIYPLRWNSS